MKKNGYTLAEMLITLGVIGLVAALCAPLVSKFKPDEVKVRYLKTYDAVVDATTLIASNEKIYPAVYQETWDCSTYPLMNIGKVTLDDGKEFEGDNKFARVLAYAMGVDDSDVNVSDDYIQESNITSHFSNPTFVAKDGTTFIVTTDRSLKTNGSGTYQTDIYFDVDGVDKGSNCYGSTCKSPDRFKLSVKADGSIVPQDKVGAGYLAKRSNLRRGADLYLADASNFEDTLQLNKLSNGMDYTPLETIKLQDNNPLISNYKWTADNYITVLGALPFHDWATALSALKGRVRAYLDLNKTKMIKEGYPPDKVQAAYDATLRYFDYFIDHLSANTDRASDKIFAVDICYLETSGHEVALIGVKYYSGNHKKESQSLAALLDQIARNTSPSGVYITKSYRNNNTYQGHVKAEKIAQKFKEMYNKIPW